MLPAAPLTTAIVGFWLIERMNRKWRGGQENTASAGHTARYMRWTERSDGAGSP
jgi:hypothetical protein